MKLQLIANFQAENSSFRRDGAIEEDDVRARTPVAVRSSTDVAAS
jgi:hypothetical protein